MYSPRIFSIGLMMMLALTSGCINLGKAGLFQMDDEFTTAGQLFAQAKACGSTQDAQTVKDSLIRFAQQKGATEAEQKSMASNFDGAIQTATVTPPPCDKIQAEQALADKLKSLSN